MMERELRFQTCRDIRMAVQETYRAIRTGRSVPIRTSAAAYTVSFLSDCHVPRLYTYSLLFLWKKK